VGIARSVPRQLTAVDGTGHNVPARIQALRRIKKVSSGKRRRWVTFRKKRNGPA
jgi:hypothetical protein